MYALSFWLDRGFCAIHKIGTVEIKKNVVWERIQWDRFYMALIIMKDLNIYIPLK